jgi:hypothetical protein
VCFQIHSTHNKCSFLNFRQKIETFYNKFVVYPKNRGEKGPNVKVLYLKEKILNRKNRNNSPLNLHPTYSISFNPWKLKFDRRCQHYLGSDIIRSCGLYACFHLAAPQNSNIVYSQSKLIVGCRNLQIKILINLVLEITIFKLAVPKFSNIVSRKL